MPGFYYFCCYSMPFLPFVFVFSLVVTIKLWMKDSLYFIGSGILASLSLLMIICGLRVFL